VTIQAGKIVLNNFRVQNGVELHIKQCPYIYVMPTAARNPDSPGSVLLTASAMWYKITSSDHIPVVSDITYSWTKKSGNGNATFSNFEYGDDVESENHLDSWSSLSDPTGSHTFLVTATASDGSYTTAECTLPLYSLENPSIVICDSTSWRVTCNSTLVTGSSTASAVNCGFLISLAKDPVLSDVASGSAVRKDISSGVNSEFSTDFTPWPLGYAYYIRSFAVLSPNSTIYGDSLVLDTTNAVQNGLVGYSLAYLQWEIDKRNGLTEGDYIPAQFDDGPPLPAPVSRKLPTITFPSVFQLHALDNPMGRDQQGTDTCRAMASLWALDLQQYARGQPMQYSSWRELYSAIAWLEIPNQLDGVKDTSIEAYLFSGYGPFVGYGNKPDIDVVPYQKALRVAEGYRYRFEEFPQPVAPYDPASLPEPHINCNLSVDECCEIDSDAVSIKSQVVSGHGVVIGISIKGTVDEQERQRSFINWQYGPDGQRVSGSLALYLPPNIATNRWVDRAKHAVVIVGWDDNFSRTRFNAAIMPTQNGAWICQNSYAPPYARFYLSYEDRFVTDKYRSCPQVFNSRQDVDFSRNTYPRDLLLRNGYIEPNNPDHDLPLYAMKSVVNQVEDGTCEQLSAIRYYISSENEMPAFDIYVNSSVGRPDDGQRIAEIMATPENSGPNYRKVGYHTLYLQPITLQSPSNGDRANNFSVVVRTEGSRVPVQFCSSEELRNGREANPDRGFFWDEDDGGWCDLADYFPGQYPEPAKLYLKAFTTSVPMQQLNPSVDAVAVSSTNALVRVKPGKHVQYSIGGFKRYIARWLTATGANGTSYIASDCAVNHDDSTGQDECSISGLTPGSTYTFQAYDVFDNGTTVYSNLKDMTMPSAQVSTYYVTKTFDQEALDNEVVEGAVNGNMINIQRCGVNISKSLFGDGSTNFDCQPGEVSGNTFEKVIANSTFPTDSDGSGTWWARLYIVMTEGFTLVSPSWPVIISPTGTN